MTPAAAITIPGSRSVTAVAEQRYRQQQQRQPAGEGGKADPVHFLLYVPGSDFAQPEMRPERSEYSDGNVEVKERPPAVKADDDAGQRQSRHGADPEGDLIDAQDRAELLGRRRVGQDGGTIGDEHGCADSLDDPGENEETGACGDGRQGRTDGEHGKSQVVDLDPADHVRDPADQQQSDRAGQQIGLADPDN